MTSPSASDARITRGQWLVLTAALLGWMFDGLEMGLFPLVARPALSDMLHVQSQVEALGCSGGALAAGLSSQQFEKDIGKWIAVITAVFLIGAATGGVLFGWLGDRIGRVRAMTLSVLTYALFSGMCGLATDAWQIAMYRFIASLGMGGEWSLGVALVMEVWPNRSRAWLAGVIGAAANFGYLLIALAGLGLSAIIGDLHYFLRWLGVGEETTATLVSHSGWRILMLFGATPALLTFLIRLFVPESQRWKHEKEKGATSHWDTRDLLGVLIGAGAALAMIWIWVTDLPTLVRIAGSAVLLAIILGGYLYPILRYVQRASTPEERKQGQVGKVIRRLILAACISGVALLGTWGSTQQAPTWADQLTNSKVPTAKAYTQMCASGGAIIGCVLAALMGDWFGRRRTYMILCAASMGSIALLFQLNDSYGSMFLFSAFVAGGITAAFYGWLPLYLPELFRTKMRATGQGFGFNFGRVLAAIGVLQLPTIMRELNVGWPGACTAIGLVYVVGMVLIWFAPETRGKPLPE